MTISRSIITLIQVHNITVLIDFGHLFNWFLLFPQVERLFLALSLLKFVLLPLLQISSIAHVFVLSDFMLSSGWLNLLNLVFL